MHVGLGLDPGHNNKIRQYVIDVKSYPRSAVQTRSRHPAKPPMHAAGAHLRVDVQMHRPGTPCMCWRRVRTGVCHSEKPPGRLQAAQMAFEPALPGVAGTKLSVTCAMLAPESTNEVALCKCTGRRLNCMSAGVLCPAEQPLGSSWQVQVRSRRL